MKRFIAVLALLSAAPMFAQYSGQGVPALTCSSTTNTNATYIDSSTGIQYICGVVVAVGTYNWFTPNPTYSYVTGGALVSFFPGAIVNSSTTPIRDLSRTVLVANMTAAATAGVTIGTTGSGNPTFQWAVTAANWYDLECKIPVTFAASATAAFQLVSTAGSSTISFVNSETMGNTGGSAAFQDLFTSAGTSLAGSVTPTTGAPGATEQVTVDMQFLSSHAGSVGLQFVGNGTNNLTILKGAECGITQIN